MYSVTLNLCNKRDIKYNKTFWYPTAKQGRYMMHRFKTLYFETILKDVEWNAFLSWKTAPHKKRDGILFLYIEYFRKDGCTTKHKHFCSCFFPAYVFHNNFLSVPSVSDILLGSGNTKKLNEIRNYIDGILNRSHGIPFQSR